MSNCRWVSKEHPDPEGRVLKAVRGTLKKLDEEEGSGYHSKIKTCGLFWDWCSLPQKDSKENGQQTKDDKRPQRTKDGKSLDDAFKEGLNSMVFIYGSIVGTAVLQWKELVRPVKGQPRVQYDESCDSDDKFSGWCTFEQGCARMVVAYLADPKVRNPTLFDDASRYHKTFKRIQQVVNSKRSKLIEIKNADNVTLHSYDDDVTANGAEAAAKVLRDTMDSVMSPRCNFMSGTSDLTNVKQMLASLDFIIKLEIERATTPKHVWKDLEEDAGARPVTV